MVCSYLEFESLGKNNFFLDEENQHSLETTLIFCNLKSLKAFHEVIVGGEVGES